MAINDNEIYGLLGSQVKDLANKIIHADNEVINLSGINNITTSNSDHQAVLLKIANAVLKHDVTIVTQTYGTTFRAPTRPARIRQNNNTYILTWSLAGLDNTSNGSSFLGVGYNPHDQYTWSFYVLPGEVANGKITHVYASFSGGDTTLASNYSDGTVTPSTDSYDRLYTLSSTGLSNLVGKDNVNSWTPTTDYGLVHKKYVDDKIATGSGAPTTSTVGSVGQLYQDTTNGKAYICTAVTGDGGDPEVFTYTWEEVISSGNNGIRVLTTADYNWNSTSHDVTEPFDSIALWLLPEGEYQWNPETVDTYLDRTTTFPSNYGYFIFKIGKKDIRNRDGIDVERTPISMTIYEEGDYRSYVGIFDRDVEDAPTVIQFTAFKDVVEMAVMRSAAAPTSSTRGQKGQLIEDTTNGDVYICTSVNVVSGQPTTYTWEKVNTNALVIREWS